MNTELFVPVEEIMAATGLTRIQVSIDVRKGRIPGTVRSRKVMVLRSEWNKYLAGEWTPRPAHGFVHRLRA